jgi:hypothetical protein
MYCAGSRLLRGRGEPGAIVKRGTLVLGAADLGEPESPVYLRARGEANGSRQLSYTYDEASLISRGRVEHPDHRFVRSPRHAHPPARRGTVRAHRAVSSVFGRNPVLSANTLVKRNSFKIFRARYTSADSDSRVDSPMLASQAPGAARCCVYLRLNGA